MKKIVLIDGNNILFRSYYATAYNGNTMKNSLGVPTNALYGLVNMLNKILNEEQPEYVMIAFDKGKTFRHDKYSTYKDGRIETPSELKQQFPLAKQLVESMGFTYLEIDNYEADDIIGTFAKKITSMEDCYATIISSDKDLLQLINDKVEVKLLKTSDYIRMTKEEFINTYGIEPINMIDLKALMGDASDNIPGVAGVGEKTALTLLKEYKTLDNIYRNIDSIKGKLQEKLINDKENAYMSYDLATIYCDVDIDTNLDNIKYRGIDTLKYINLLETFEFYSIIKKLNIKEEVMRPNVEQNIDVKVIENASDIKIYGNFSIYLEMFREVPLGFGIYSEKDYYYVPFELVKENPMILVNDYEKYTYDLKQLLVVLSNNSLKINNCHYDAMIAGYLLNKNIKDDIAYYMKTMNYNIAFYEEVYGSNSKMQLPDINIVALNAIKKAKFIYETKDIILKELEDYEALSLFNDIEIPLTYVLADMEITGVKVDREFLENMKSDVKKKLDILTSEIYSLAGCEFNIMSPKQLGEVLFDKMQLPYPKKIKDNSYSTSKDILDKIKFANPIIDKIEEYRNLSKLYTNNIIGLIDVIKEDGKVHTTFNQTLTRTGRLSSANPNLQNIPIRLEYGKLIRKAFIPSEDSIFVSSDYSQIELRIFAHMSQANNLVDAFIEDKDIHTKTASDIFKVSFNEVTKDMRRQAKAVNFGILYGISSFGLSEDLNIDFSSAKKFIDDYLNTFPGIKEYMNKIIQDAYNTGYAKTIFNRKRVIDELKNSNYLIRSSGERMALNTPIQGSSADIIKKAMIDIYKEFNRQNLKSKMLIQVHDELVFEVKKYEKERIIKIIKDIMENVYQLSVPLKVDINEGNDWYEAK